MRSSYSLLVIVLMTLRTVTQLAAAAKGVYRKPFGTVDTLCAAGRQGIAVRVWVCYVYNCWQSSSLVV